MALAKKDLFLTTDIRNCLRQPFPVESFSYDNTTYTVLGKSNKDNLIPVNADTIELQEIVTSGCLSQFICADDEGNIYDAALYRDADETAYLYAIGTREKPENKKGK